MSKSLDLSPLFQEPDHNIKVTRRELMKLCMKADAALGDAGDGETGLYNVLYDIRETLSEFLEEPERRIR